VSLKDRLKEAMLSKNISQADLAEAVGISAVAIGKILSGETSKSRYIIAISAALDINPMWLQSGEGEITEPKQVSQPKQVSPYTPYYPTSLDQDAVKWVLEFIDKHLEEEMKAKNRDRRAKIWALLYDSYINDRVLSEQNEEFILRLLL
jgi:transcriptional regulator with XRE-family HTH domain